MKPMSSHKAVSGAVWASIDRFGSMILQFVDNLVLAHLLLPKDFGIIGMLAIFIAVSNTLIDGGFSSALIQKKTPTQTDYSTIFYWNIIFSISLYLLLFLISPFIAKYFNMLLLCDVLRVIAISIVINSIISIQRTRLQKDLAFKIIAIINLSSYVISALSGILMALNGFGVWSLVAMQLIYGIFSVISLYIITKWVPSRIFSKNSLKELFGFGGYIMAANILQTISLNIQGIIIGKRFSATQMGYYSQAYKLDQITSYSIPQVIVQVMYPIFSSLQDDKNKLNNIVLLNLRVIAFVVFPVLSMLILIAPQIINFLYGEKWLSAAPYFRIFCVGGFFVCLQNINYYAVAAVGKSKSLFNWSFYKWGFLLLALFIGMYFGMYGILWGMVISSINIFCINSYLCAKHTKLSMKKQIFAVLPILLIAIISIAVSLLIEYILDTNNFLISIVLNLFFYLSICYMVRLKAMEESYLIIRKILHRG